MYFWLIWLGKVSRGVEAASAPDAALSVQSEVNSRSNFKAFLEIKPARKIQFLRPLGRRKNLVGAGPPEKRPPERTSIVKSEK